MRERLKEERGAVAVLAALTIVILFAAVAFVIDISRLYHERQVLQNAVDFGALAGAQELPVQGTAQANVASQIARTVATANAPQVATAGLNILYQCVVGDRNGDGIADPEDIPFVCGPTGTWTSGWTAKGSRMVHDCNPFAGDKCNTIKLTTSNSIPYYFAPVIGINTGSTGSVTAASCKGACGAASSPIDVVMVLDRTGSMSPGDITNVKNAAISVLSYYDSAQQWVGIVALPYGQPLNKCQVNSPQAYPAGAASLWQVTPLTKDYTVNGKLNMSSTIVQNINCLVRAGSPVVTVNGVPNGAGHTNLGDPLDAAREMLSLQGRPTVPDVIIFMTDGEANQPVGYQPCGYLNAKADIAKAEGQTIFTIGYGIGTKKCSDTGGQFASKYATYNLAETATDSIDNAPGGCAATENKDNDHYFCTPTGADLEPVFRQVAAAAIETAHLID
jgi:putative Flp pilus-assembly TadE/G-like protein/von Willebrand factor type A domain-containing protein